jgi:iron complex transport system substrate-binding protein
VSPAVSLFVSLSLLGAEPSTKPQQKLRVVCLGGVLTEIAFALGAGDLVVGVDKSSLYPEAASALPQVGYFRAFSAEGVLSLEPDLVLLLDGAGPSAAVEVLGQAGVRLATLPETVDVQGAKARILAVGQVLGRGEAARAQVAAMEAALAGLTRPKPSPKVLFIYARGGGTLNVSGRGTAADAMLRLVGATNAVTELEGFKPLTAEAVIGAAPDVILMTDHGLAAVGGAQGLLKLPGIALTPAGQAQRVVALPDLLLLGFGPRLGEAAQRLAEAL